MASLTSLRLTPSTKGTAQQFILDWLDKLRIYEDLTPSSSRFPDIMKKAMLQNALIGIKAFQDVKVAEQLDIAKGQGPVTYQAYVSLVQQVAAAYDMKVGPSRPLPENLRKVNVVEIDDNEYGDYGNEEYDYFEVDTNEYFGSTAINVAHTQGRGKNNFVRRPSLPKAVWNAMSRSDQMAWDNIFRTKRNLK